MEARVQLGAWVPGLLPCPIPGGLGTPPTPRPHLASQTHSWSRGESLPPGGHPGGCGTLTHPLSMPTVGMTTTRTCCSHASCQKSSRVFFRSPWVVMNSCGRV